jgi:hypothetical protein
MARPVQDSLMTLAHTSFSAWPYRNIVKMNWSESPRNPSGRATAGCRPLPICRPGKGYFNFLRRSGIDFQVEAPMFRAETGRLIHLTVLPRNFE